ncbi:hypothetical protein Tco_0904860 [Tanacetum coccineum]
MRSCRIKEELTWVKTFGKEVEEYVTKVIAKDGTVTRFGGRFPHFIKEEEEKKPKPYNLYRFVDLMENEQVYAKTGFAPHRIPQSEGNHNGWLSEEEEADSDSESTAIKKMPPRCAIGEDENPPDITTLLAQQLQNLLPKKVNQVMLVQWLMRTMVIGNGANGGNGAEMEYDGKGGAVVLTCWIERMETVIDNSGCAENQKVRYVVSLLVKKALLGGILSQARRVEEAANAMSWNDFKHYWWEEFDRVGGSEGGIRWSKEVLNFVGRLAPSRVGYAGSKPALGWRRNERGGGNQVRGRAYNASMNAAEAAKDSSIVTGTFSLNDHFATVLFDSRADFSFTNSLTISVRAVTSGEGDEEVVVLTFEKIDLFHEVRTFDLFSIIVKASRGVRFKRLPPRAAFRES